MWQAGAERRMRWLSIEAHALSQLWNEPIDRLFRILSFIAHIDPRLDLRGRQFPVIHMFLLFHFGMEQVIDCSVDIVVQSRLAFIQTDRLLIVVKEAYVWRPVKSFIEVWFDDAFYYLSVQVIVWKSCSMEDFYEQFLRRERDDPRGSIDMPKEHDARSVSIRIE